jgi:hypothetical protein
MPPRRARAMKVTLPSGCGISVMTCLGSAEAAL